MWIQKTIALFLLGVFSGAAALKGADLRFDEIHTSPDGEVTFKVVGANSEAVTLLSSYDMRRWIMEATKPSTSSLEFTVASGAAEAQYFRAVVGLPQERPAEITILPSEVITTSNILIRAEYSAQTREELSFEWNLGDGRYLQSRDAITSYTNSGAYAVEFSAFNRDGVRTAFGSKLLLVQEPGAARGPTGELSIKHLGDLDADGALSTNDLRLLNGYLSGAFVLNNQQLEAADFDLNGAVSTEDELLIRSAIQSGVGWPTAISPAQAKPGSIVTIYHPALLSFASDVEVQDSFGKRVDSPRLTPGRLSFILLPEAVISGIVSSFVTFKLVSSNQSLGDFHVEVPPFTESNPEDAMNFLSNSIVQSLKVQGEVLEALGEIQVALQATTTVLSGMPTGGVFAALHSVLSANVEETKMVLQHITQLSTEERLLFTRIGEAHGIFDRARTTQALKLDSLFPRHISSLSAEPDPDLRIFEVICLIEQLEPFLRTQLKVFDLTCQVATLIPLISAIVNPAFLAALPPVLGVCLNVFAGTAIVNLILDLKPVLSKNISLRASSTGPVIPGGAVLVTPTLPYLISYPNLCDQSAKWLDKKFAKFLTKQVIERIALKFPAFASVMFILSTKTTAPMEKAIEKALAKQIGNTTLGQIFQSLVSEVCRNADQKEITGFPLKLNAAELSVMPPTGKIQFTESGKAFFYRFPESGDVTITAHTTMCGVSRTGSLALQVLDKRAVYFSSTAQDALCFAFNDCFLKPPEKTEVSWEFETGDSGVGWNICIDWPVDGIHVGRMFLTPNNPDLPAQIVPFTFQTLTCPPELKVIHCIRVYTISPSCNRLGP